MAATITRTCTDCDRPCEGTDLVYVGGHGYQLVGRCTVAEQQSGECRRRYYARIGWEA